MRYLYLHGWCSSPQSAKAAFFRQRFAERQLELLTPDLNLPDIQSLTLTRQLQQAQALIQNEPEVTVIGSSLGGLTALFLAEQCLQIKRLLLIAPALNFYHCALRSLGQQQHVKWQASGVLSVPPHYGCPEHSLLNYHFLEDIKQYQASQEHLQRPVPGLVFHGRQDTDLDWQDTQAFCASRPYLAFHALEGGHSLYEAREQIWQLSEAFLLAGGKGEAVVG